MKEKILLFTFWGIMMFVNVFFTSSAKADNISDAEFTVLYYLYEQKFPTITIYHNEAENNFKSFGHHKFYMSKGRIVEQADYSDIIQSLKKCLLGREYEKGQNPARDFQTAIGSKLDGDWGGDTWKIFFDFINKKHMKIANFSNRSFYLVNLNAIEASLPEDYLDSVKNDQAAASLIPMKSGLISLLSHPGDTSNGSQPEDTPEKTAPVIEPEQKKTKKSDARSPAIVNTAGEGNEKKPLDTVAATASFGASKEDNKAKTAITKDNARTEISKMKDSMNLLTKALNIQTDLLTALIGEARVKTEILFFTYFFLVFLFLIIILLIMIELYRKLKSGQEKGTYEREQRCNNIEMLANSTLINLYKKIKDLHEHSTTFAMEGLKEDEEAKNKVSTMLENINSEIKELRNKLDDLRRDQSPGKDEVRKLTQQLMIDDKPILKLIRSDLNDLSTKMEEIKNYVCPVDQTLNMKNPSEIIAEKGKSGDEAESKLGAGKDGGADMEIDW